MFRRTGGRSGLIRRVGGRADTHAPKLPADWARRLKFATPGLLALGLDPNIPPDELRWHLSRAEKWVSGKGPEISKNRANLLGSNLKMKKSATVDVFTRGLSLSPALESGVNTCPLATSCVRVCIGSATGQYRQPGKNRIRIKKTLLWTLFPTEFAQRTVRSR